MDFKAACVIGWPVEHSRSPLIHDYWIRQFGLPAAYRREAVPPERFADFVAHLADHGYVGANVTVPHKEAALALSMPDALAQAVGAANTLWFEGGKLRSTNTDVEGFLQNLDVSAPAILTDIATKKALDDDIKSRLTAAIKDYKTSFLADLKDKADAATKDKTSSNAPSKSAPTPQAAPQPAAVGHK